MHSNDIDYDEVLKGEIQNIDIIESDSVLMEQKTEDDFDDKVRIINFRAVLQTFNKHSSALIAPELNCFIIHPFAVQKVQKV